MYLLPFDIKRLSSLDISDTLLGAARANKIANFFPNIINGRFLLVGSLDKYFNTKSRSHEN